MLHKYVHLSELTWENRIYCWPTTTVLPEEG